MRQLHLSQLGAVCIARPLPAATATLTVAQALGGTGPESCAGPDPRAFRSRRMLGRVGARP